MAARTPKTQTVLLHRRHRTVVLAKPWGWVERLDDGQLVIHPGKLLTGGQEPLKALPEAKPCTRCKRPAWTATARGRAFHETCEGWSHAIPDTLFGQIVFGVAADLGAGVLSDTTT